MSKIFFQKIFRKFFQKFFGKSFVKAVSFIIIAAMASGSLAACGNKTASKDSGQVSQGSDTKGNSTVSSENTLPFSKNPITLKYWVGMHKSASKILKNYGENAAYQELAKRTNIKLEFLHPPVGQENEQYKLMIAAKDLPDLIQEWKSPAYPGGSDKAIDDGVYIKLNDMIEKYAPNYKKLRASRKDIANQTMTDRGNIWSFANLEPEAQPSWSGPILRKDWLDELGLKVPETISDWYNVLKAFKEKKNVQAPFILPSTGYDTRYSFTGAFDVAHAFFKVGNTVKYGPIEPGFREYLTEMNKWYSEGLIDKDFATRDLKTIDSMALTGKAGAWINSFGAGIDTYIGTKKEDPKYQLTAAPNPSLKPGQVPHTKQKSWVNKGYETVITSACKYPAEAVKLMDYHFGQDGFMLFNWGIENVSYKLNNGKPEFTDIMLKNPEGPYDTVNWKWKLHVGPYLRDWKAYPPFTKESLEAMERWNKAQDDYIIPPTSRTPEESEIYSGIMSEIDTYVNQMILKFIIGTEPLSKYDSFVSQIKKMNIDQAIKIEQAALERYNKR